jgi:hypothetical protein
MANDALFAALAQAKSLPSHAYRTADAALQIPGEALGGYEEGLQANQQIQQAKMLNTPLGQIWQDPSQIPYGLPATMRVRDLMAIAPTMSNYVPSGFANTVASASGANTGGGPPPSNVPPTAPPPIPPQTPATPAPTPGGAMLTSAGGVGNDSGGAFAPGTPTSIQAPAPTGGPPIAIPPGGMSREAFQLLQPALKAGQDERNFQQNQAREAAQFQTGQQNENTRQGKNITAENNRTMAGETSKIAPSITEAGTISDDINALMPLYKGYSPIPFAGTALANIASKSGTTSFGGPTVQTGKQIQQIVPALSAKVNYLLNKRFNSGEAAMLQQQVVPNATDNEQSAMQKIGNLRRLTSVMQSGDVNALQMVASSIAGKPVNPALPSSGGNFLQDQSSSTGNPDADRAIAQIQASGLDPNSKQARIQAVMARLQQ